MYLCEGLSVLSQILLYRQGTTEVIVATTITNSVVTIIAVLTMLTVLRII